MNYFDYVLMLPVIYGLYSGFSKGFILELASLLALVLGVYGAMHFSFFTFEYLRSSFEIEASYLQLASYGLTFLLIVLAITLSAKLLTLFVKMVALGFINRTLGALFGGLQALLILSVLLLFFDGLNKQFRLVKDDVIEASVLYHPIKNQAAAIYPYVLKEFENHKKRLDEIEDQLTE